MRNETKKLNQMKPRGRIYVKGYGFLFFAKNIGKYSSNEYSQKLIDTAKKIYNRCNKNSVGKSNTKAAEATGDLIGNKIADKIRSISKRPVKEILNNDKTKKDAEITTNEKRYISPEERQQIINELTLAPKHY